MTDLPQLLTTKAHCFLQGALFAATDPVALAKVLGETKEVSEAAASIENALEQYTKDIETYEKKVILIERQFKQDTKREQALRNLAEPQLHLAIDCIPNTAEHLAKYAPTFSYDPFALQAVVDFNLIPNELPVADWVRLNDHTYYIHLYAYLP